MDKVFQLHTSYEPIIDRHVEEPVLSEVMNCFLEKGYKFIHFIAEPLKKVGNVYLPIDKDIEFLLEGYLTINDQLRKGNKFNHFCFLGDGLLEISAAIEISEVTVNYNYCPGLNRANLILISDQVSLNEYCFFLEEGCSYLAQGL